MGDESAGPQYQKMIYFMTYSMSLFSRAYIKCFSIASVNDTEISQLSNRWTSSLL